MNELPVPQPALRRLSIHSLERKTISLSCNSLLEAKDWLLGMVTKFIWKLKNDTLLCHEEVIDSFMAFSEVLESYVTKQGGNCLDPLAKRSLAMLKLYEAYCRARLLHIFRAFQLVSSRNDYTEHSTYKRPRQLIADMFSAVVDLALEVLLLDDLYTPELRPRFCLDIGVSWVLFSVASQCRDPAVRRRALSLIPCTLRQEGFWNSELGSKIAHRILDLEETGIDAQTTWELSLNQRVRVMGVYTDAENGQARTVFRRPWTHAQWEEIILL